eukprot:TRINITY_DN25242_c0_g1_i1.p2 TRINITY_DN25242_c0_g1~~TRINITY_DN25242_c0_g1_i1.p2  ORF type:complete len:152 (+),score=40.31 TRINITY_DN25242_c0_g1_i1:204-659(+)
MQPRLCASDSGDAQRASSCHVCLYMPLHPAAMNMATGSWAVVTCHVQACSDHFKQEETRRICIIASDGSQRCARPEACALGSGNKGRMRRQRRRRQVRHLQQQRQRRSRLLQRQRVPPQQCVPRAHFRAAPPLLKGSETMGTYRAGRCCNS